MTAKKCEKQGILSYVGTAKHLKWLLNLCQNRNISISEAPIKPLASPKDLSQPVAKPN